MYLWGAPEQLQYRRLDKAYEEPTGEAAVGADGYGPHIRRPGEEQLDRAGGAKRFPD